VCAIFALGFQMGYQNTARMTLRRSAAPSYCRIGPQVPIVYSTVLVDGKAQADIVAQQFGTAEVDIIVCVADPWSFPQLTTISLFQQFPKRAEEVVFRLPRRVHDPRRLRRLVQRVEPAARVLQRVAVVVGARKGLETM